MGKLVGAMPAVRGGELRWQEQRDHPDPRRRSWKKKIGGAGCRRRQDRRPAGLRVSRRRACAFVDLHPTHLGREAAAEASGAEREPGASTRSRTPLRISSSMITDAVAVEALGARPPSSKGKVTSAPRPPSEGA